MDYAYIDAEDEPQPPPPPKERCPWCGAEVTGVYSYDRRDFVFRCECGVVWIHKKEE